MLSVELKSGPSGCDTFAPPTNVVPRVVGAYSIEGDGNIEEKIV